jgi:hypothetical protein
MWVHNDTQEDRKFKVGVVAEEGVGGAGYIVLVIDYVQHLEVTEPPMH